MCYYVNMAFTANDILNSALLPFSGTSREAVSNPKLTVYKAALQVRSHVDILESKRVVPLLPAVYQGDNLYIVPNDFDKIIDLAPQDGRDNQDYADFYNTSSKTISVDRSRGTHAFNTEYRMGTRLLRVLDNSNQDTPVVINSCTSLIADGNFSLSGDGSNLGINEVFTLNGGAAIDFDITQSSGYTSLIANGMVNKDIDHLTRDAVFSCAMYTPSNLVGNVDSVQLKIGSDSSNYYSITSTSNSYGNALTEGYNTIRFQRRDASETGTVVDEEISYMEITINHSNLETVVKGVKIDNVLANLGVGYTLSYYSKFYFVNADGNYIEKPTTPDLTEETIFSTDTANLVDYEAQRILDYEINGQSGGLRDKEAKRVLFGLQNVVEERGLYAEYRNSFPSERAVNITSY